MKVKCQRKALAEAFQAVSGLLSQNIARPVYRNVKVDVSAEGIVLSATDLEIGARLKTKAGKGEEPGVILMPHDRITSILREAAHDEIEVQAEGTAITITEQDGVYKMVSEDPAEFDDMPAFPEGSCIEIDREVLLDAARKVVFATSEERGRYALRGIMLAVEGKNAEFVASDGHRLARVKCKVGGSADFAAHKILPRRGLEQLCKMLGDDDKVVKIAVDDRRFFGMTENVLVYGMLVEGQFPNHYEIIPKSNPQKIDLSKAGFLSAARRASLMSDPRSSAVVLKFEAGKITFRAETADVGEAKVVLEADYKGEEVELSFNPRFFIEALNVIDEDTVKFEIGDDEVPAVIKGGANYTYVIMPLTTRYE